MSLSDDRYPNGMSKSLTLTDLRHQIEEARTLQTALIAHRDVFVAGFLVAGQVASQITSFTPESLEDDDVIEAAYQSTLTANSATVASLEAQLCELTVQIKAAS